MSSVSIPRFAGKLWTAMSRGIMSGSEGSSTRTASQDRQAHGKKPPIYEKIPELKELGRYLASS